MNTIKMQIIRPCLAIFSLLILSGFATQIHGSKQSQALSQLHRSKLKNVAHIDKSPFVAILHANATKTHPQEGLKVKDRIVKLPGQPNVKFSQYGGYVTVDKKAGRAMFYYLVEAEQAKDSSPLLLWLNGGPGCSSLAYGAMLELGPFRIHSDGKTLYRNRFSWNHAANVLFLESPAGVGFSYSNRTSDYDASGDRNTAADNYVFLVNWLERFPEYKGREFYISGESYAGHYVPQLAHTILYHNKRANKTIINLKGIIIFKFDPCSEDYAYAYLNRPDVQQALHANVTKLSHDWEPCSDVITWGDSASTVLPLLHEFLENGLRVWIFSGDIDGRVPVTSTKYSLDKMNLPVKTEWHAWFLSGEVAGYTQVFEGGLTFATVRHAGHQVPSYQPARGLSLIKHFLDGTPLPDTKRYN
ncbi:serine carboxypeptidase-like 40 isoform X2 [Malus domestica]|uniref:serine carboxypeptidase-like 40 isoform X2 n=1 Tax=Malus domestica TaxID=3750 RepID=UPI0010AAC426|nr:serine carboxypeptidase-like 40 isoform X2 [Malus domestica]